MPARHVVRHARHPLPVPAAQRRDGSRRRRGGGSRGGGGGGGGVVLRDAHHANGVVGAADGHAVARRRGRDARQGAVGDVHERAGGVDGTPQPSVRGKKRLPFREKKETFLDVSRRPPSPTTTSGRAPVRSRSRPARARGGSRSPRHRVRGIPRPCARGTRRSIRARATPRTAKALSRRSFLKTRHHLVAHRCPRSPTPFEEPLAKARACRPRPRSGPTVRATRSIRGPRLCARWRSCAWSARSERDDTHRVTEKVVDGVREERRIVSRSRGRAYPSSSPPRPRDRDAFQRASADERASFMPEARVGLARELATKSETRSIFIKDVFIEKSDRRKTLEESKKGIFARGSCRHSGMRAVTFQASSACTTHLAERAVAAAERRRASGLIDRCRREGTDVRTRARRLTDAVSDD